MGEGPIDQRRSSPLPRALPAVPVHIETISGFNRELPYLRGDFWKAWPDMPARAFARFLALARQGTSAARRSRLQPVSTAKSAEQTYQRGEIERSLKYCKDVLGLGLTRVITCCGSRRDLRGPQMPTHSDDAVIAHARPRQAVDVWPLKCPRYRAVGVRLRT